MKALLFNDTSAEAGHPGCWAVVSALRAGLEARGCTLTGYLPFWADWSLYTRQIASAAVDAVIVNGEGSIHSGTSRARRLARLGTFAAEHLHVPAYLVNATVDAMPAESLNDLKRYTHIWVRETRSQDYLTSAGIPSTFVPDLSFFSAQTQARSMMRTRVLVTDSVRPEKAAWLRSQAQACGVRYMPIMPADAPTFRDQQRRHGLVRKIQRMADRWLPLASPIPLTTSPHAHAHTDLFVQALKEADLAITGRFHAMTLALAHGVPVVCLPSNTHKMESVLQDVFGNTRRVLSQRTDFDTPSLLEEFAPYTAHETQSILTYIANGQRTAAHMFDTISARPLSPPKAQP